MTAAMDLSFLLSQGFNAACTQAFVVAMGEPSNDTQRTLWIGDLGYWMDENFLYNLFAGTGTVTSVKIIRSKATNVSEGYGFIEFNSHEAASQVRQHAGACLLVCLNCPFVHSACFLTLCVGAVGNVQILTTYNGCPIPGTDQIFRLNWAAFGVGKGSTEGEQGDRDPWRPGPLGMSAPLPPHSGAWVLTLSLLASLQRPTTRFSWATWRRM